MLKGLGPAYEGYRCRNWAQVSRSLADLREGDPDICNGSNLDSLSCLLFGDGQMVIGGSSIPTLDSWAKIMPTFSFFKTN